MQRTLGMLVTVDRVLWSTALVEDGPNSKNSLLVEINQQHKRDHPAVGVIQNHFRKIILKLNDILMLNFLKEGDLENVFESSFFT